MDEKFYSLAELAALKGVQKDAIRAMIRKGRLRPFKTVNGSETYLFDEAVRYPIKVASVIRSKSENEGRKVAPVVGGGEAPALGSLMSPIRVNYS